MRKLKSYQYQSLKNKDWIYDFEYTHKIKECVRTKL